jgi:hypothetical protein
MATAQQQEREGNGSQQCSHVHRACLRQREAVCRERGTPAQRNTLPGRRRSGTGPRSFVKPRRASVEVESASARCRSRAQLLVLCSAPRSEREMLAARRPTRAAYGDGLCPRDSRRLRRLPHMS